VQHSDTRIRSENGNLATAASGLEIVTADGTVLNLSRERDGETFNGAVVGLGALGVITKVTLDIQPSFTMRQYVYEDLPLGELKEHFDAIESSGYSVSLFTDWYKKRINEPWIKSRTEDGQEFHASLSFMARSLLFATYTIEISGGIHRNGPGTIERGVEGNRALDAVDRDLDHVRECVLHDVTIAEASMATPVGFDRPVVGKTVCTPA
jgi:FAD/FMN-containing dehydrogenase